MSSKLPQISGERLARVLVKLGFVLVNQKGSHMKFVKEYDNKTKETIMVYAHHTVKKGTLARILDQLNISVEELKSLL